MNVIRVADPRQVPTLFEAVRRAVVGTDQGVAGVQCHDLNAELVVGQGFAKALAFRLGVAADDRYALHERLARRTAGRPLVCFVGLLPSEKPTALADAVDSVDLIGQLSPTARVCVFYADTARHS